jgi:hypothetical protein
MRYELALGRRSKIGQEDYIYIKLSEVIRMELWAVEYKLSNASQEYVFDWLKDNQVEDHDWGNDREKLEESLLARNDNLINLGLALYANEPAIGYKLYRSGDSVLRRAVLSGRTIRGRAANSWVLNDDVIPDLIEAERQRAASDKHDDFFDDDGISLLRELLQNPSIPDHLLEAVFKKSDPFSDLDDDLWVKFVHMTCMNKRISTPYSETWMDGYAEFTYNAVFYAGWKLFREFPVNNDSALVLWDLSYKLHPKTHDIDIFEIMERWRSDDKDKEKSYSRVRSGLVRVIGNHSNEFKGLQKSGDLALRRGYYERVSNVKYEDVEAWFERDGKEFLDSALNNTSFFKNEDVRDALRQACWDEPDKHSRMDYPNYFNSSEEHLTAKHPEWFKDSRSEEIPFDEIKDPDERREKRLEYLSSQVSDLKKTLVGDKDEDEYPKPPEFDVRSSFDYLGSELAQLSLHLQNLYQKSSFSWGTLTAGLVIGYILAIFLNTS